MKALQKLNREIKRDLTKCRKCGKRIVPDKEAVRFGTKDWDGHSYKFNCECYSEDTRINIG